MYLTEAKFHDIVKRQFSYKLKAYSSVFSSLLTVQIVGLLLSLGGGSGYMGTGANSFSLNITFYNGMIIIIFTLIWSFITAIIMTTKAYRNDDFTFISNRLSSNLSNLYFLITVSVIGGITATLSGYLLKVITYFIVDGSILQINNMSIAELLISMVATILYVFLFAAFGYFIGSIVQLNKWYKVVLPTIIVGYLLLEVRMNGELYIIPKLVKFFNGENMFILFFFKVIFIAALLFSSSMMFSNRIEVRQ